MLIDIFSELQRAHTRGRSDEGRVIKETLAQARLADRYDYNCWWTVEHHGTPAFSYSSTPELFGVLLSQHTRRIRIGHSGVLAPFNINYPIRVAERSGFLDLVSGGRLEMGIARSAFMEIANFSLDPDLLRAQTGELIKMLPRMWTDHKFSWDSELICVPEIDIVPKPVQSPHPPIYMMCTSPDGFRMAGALGVGSIGTTLLQPLEGLARLRQTYKEGLAERQATNPDPVLDQFGLFTFVHCAESRQEAIDSRAAEAILWYINAVPRFFKSKRSALIEAFRGQVNAGEALRQIAEARAGGTLQDDTIDPNDSVPVIRLLNRQELGLPVDPVEAYEVLEGMDSIVIGDPDACVAKLRTMEEIGCDRLLCFMQMGALPHSRVMSSIRMVGESVIPKLRDARPRAAALQG